MKYHLIKTISCYWITYLCGHIQWMPGVEGVSEISIHADGICKKCLKVEKNKGPE